MGRITNDVKKGLKKGFSMDRIREDLIKKGGTANDIDRELLSFSGKALSYKKTEEASNSKKVCIKEFFDRIGYGFGSQHFVNILFFNIGASYFLLGILNGLRALLGVLLTSFLDDYSNFRPVKKKFIGLTGIVLAFSFMLIAISIFTRSVMLFAVSLIVSSIGAVSYGGLYQNLLRRSLAKEKNHFLRYITVYGIIITSFCLLAAGYLMDKFPATGVPFSVFGANLWVYGYLVVFFVAAICFFISGYVLSLIREKHENFSSDVSLSYVFRVHLSRFRDNFPLFTKNKALLVLFIASTVTGFVQTLGNSYYAVYIYETFWGSYFGGFMNVAAIFLIALMASFFAPGIVKSNSKAYGKFPMLVFGTLLMAIMPLTYYYNPTNLVAISMGTLLGIIGAAIVGFAHGLLASDLMREDQRKAYFLTYGFLIALPYILFIPLGSYVAQVFGLRLVFLALGIILSCFVVPLYVLIIVLNRKNEKI